MAGAAHTRSIIAKCVLDTQEKHAETFFCKSTLAFGGGAPIHVDTDTEMEAIRDYVEGESTFRL